MLELIEDFYLFMGSRQLLRPCAKCFFSNSYITLPSNARNVTEFCLLVALPFERHGALHAVVQRRLFEPCVVLRHRMGGHFDSMVC